MDKASGSAFEAYEETHTSYDLTRLPIGMEAILNRLALRKEARILDAGCGTGLYLEQLLGKENISLLYGIDASQEGIRQSALKVNGASNVKLEVGNIRTIPAPDRSFDMALYNFVLHHLDCFSNLETTLAEAYRVLDHFGEMIIGTCTQEQLSTSGYSWYYGYFPEAAKALAARFIPVDYLQTLLLQTGFRCVRTLGPVQTCYTDHSFDPEGPFRAEWRAGDSLFSYYRDQQQLLLHDLAKLREAIDNGSVLEEIDAAKQRTEIIGQAVFILAEKSTEIDSSC